ncbi:MAG: hypothetical protein ACK2UX_10225 [Anaerolineae bacterium]|jgi:hypothetical protein
MADKTGKTRPRRLPKGQRAHVRRLKQAARKAGIAYIRPASALRRTGPSTKEDHL